MPRNVVPESSWDPTLRQMLVTFYHDLVQTELNDPIPLRSSFLGIRKSQRFADDLVSAKKFIPPFGSCGVFEDGIPFYHLHTQTLSTDELKRLQEHEVRLKTGKFTSKEDQQMQTNWVDYCEISGADPDEAPSYMGCALDRRKQKGSKYFRTWMCRGLPDRTGIQVYRRAQIIFHPSNKADGLLRPWTSDEIKTLRELGPSGKWAEIGARLQRLRYHCQKQYACMTQNKVTSDKDGDLRLFYKSVSRVIKKDLVKAFATNDLDELEERIDWQAMGRVLSRDPEDCQTLYKDLKCKMEEAREESQGRGATVLFQAACKRLPKMCRRICRLQNKKTPRIKVPLRNFSRHIKDLCAYHENDLQTLKRPYRFIKNFSNSEAFEEYDETFRTAVLRRLTYVVSVFHDHGVFDFLPHNHQDLLTRLQMVAYVMRKIFYTSVKEARTFELAKRFIEKRGWKPRRNIHAYKLKESAEQRTMKKE